MLNLLFISDNPKAEHIKNELQPLLKVKIDVVSDFDRGMKDVFEKRPATVCIQDHIGTVSGESVARHIKMLLGNSAPIFILFHSGNGKARVISGLFDHLIDLSLSNDSIIGEILGTLKTIFGGQWERIFIPPKQTLEEAISRKMAPAAQSEPAPLSEDASTINSPVKVMQANDEIVEQLLAKSRKAALEEKAVPEEKAAQEEKAATSTAKDYSTLEADASTGGKKPKSNSTFSPSAPAPPAEAFRISRNPAPVDEPIPEDILFAFEENYRSRSLLKRRSYVIGLICLVCFAGGWYLLTQNSQMVDSLTQWIMPASEPKQAPQNSATAIPEQKPASSPVPPPVVTPTLPSFIPQEGIDHAFALKNPGWNRFVGEKYDFRVFSAPGRIEAIQVLSLGAAIPESLIKSVLQEFTGISKYQILSRSTKDGIRVESGKVQNKGDIILYKKNGAVEAFVVSVN